MEPISKTSKGDQLHPTKRRRQWAYCCIHREQKQTVQTARATTRKQQLQHYPDTNLTMADAAAFFAKKKKGKKKPFKFNANTIDASTVTQTVHV